MKLKSIFIVMILVGCCTACNNSHQQSQLEGTIRESFEKLLGSIKKLDARIGVLESQINTKKSIQQSVNDTNSDAPKEYQLQPRLVELYYKESLITTYTTNQPFEISDGWESFAIEGKTERLYIAVHGEYRIVLHSKKS